MWDEVCVAAVSVDSKPGDVDGNLENITAFPKYGRITGRPAIRMCRWDSPHFSALDSDSRRLHLRPRFDVSMSLSFSESGI